MRAVLGGVWLNATYAAALQQTRSPRQANGQWGASNITELLIDPQSYRGDSMRVELGAANHEGLPLRYVHLRAGPVAGSWVTTAVPNGGAAVRLETSLRYQVKNADTLLYLDQRDRKTRRLTSTAFRKLRGVAATGASLDDPLRYFVQELTFTGTHAVLDSKGSPHAVRLWPTGQVQGWPGFHTYQVTTDFEGPFRELDAVIFDMHQKSQREYAFEIRGDTIRLYTVRDDTTTYERQRGRLSHTLVRQQKAAR